jgi:hypothetical protein
MQYTAQILQGSFCWPTSNALCSLHSDHSRHRGQNWPRRGRRINQYFLGTERINKPGRASSITGGHFSFPISLLFRASWTPPRNFLPGYRSKCVYLHVPCFDATVTSATVLLLLHPAKDGMYMGNSCWKDICKANDIHVICMIVWRSLHCNHAIERKGKSSDTEDESMAQGCNMVDIAARAC